MCIVQGGPIGIDRLTEKRLATKPNQFRWCSVSNCRKSPPNWPFHHFVTCQSIQVRQLYVRPAILTHSNGLYYILEWCGCICPPCPSAALNHSAHQLDMCDEARSRYHSIRFHLGRLTSQFFLSGSFRLAFDRWSVLDVR